MGYDDAELSVLFVDDHVISDLNLRYRNKQGPTNVLAFSMLEGEERLISKMLGDIVISIETALSEAMEEGIELKERIRRLLAHGLLHLIGYDHKTEQEALTMSEIEDRLVDIMGRS